LAIVDSLSSVVVFETDDIVSRDNRRFALPIITQSTVPGWEPVGGARRDVGRLVGAQGDFALAVHDTRGAETTTQCSLRRW